jgi:ABC-2 type transport system ATP-binding protein
LQNIYSTGPAISVIHVTKTFRRSRNRNTILNSVKEAFSGDSNNSRHHFILSDLKFDILDGEKIGIVGVNGSGKTTLLKTIAGLYRPNSCTDPIKERST